MERTIAPLQIFFPISPIFFPGPVLSFTCSVLQPPPIYLVRICVAPLRTAPTQDSQEGKNWRWGERGKRQTPYKVVPNLWKKELQSHCNVTSDRGGWADS